MSLAKKYVLAKPGCPNWPAAVQRARELLLANPTADLANFCQNVPLKYLQQLRSEATKK